MPLASIEQDWSGADWEELVHTLLMSRYQLGDYQRVPSIHSGDCGIESFSTDGNAYQCYAAQEYTSAEDLYEKQRDKMSTDIKKFYENHSRLRRILGTLKIRRWLLVVPRHSSANLLGHASAKTQEVVAKQLDYVAPDFRVHVLDFQSFRAEYSRMVQQGIQQVTISPVSIDEASLGEFAAAAENSELLQNLREKLSRLPRLSNDAAARTEVERILTEGFLEGQAYLDQLHANYPDLHRKILTFKRRKEHHLALLSRIIPSPSDARLESQIKELGEQIQGEFPTVSSMAEALVSEAIADWLMRCPLDFPPAA
jgi:hypothetical protein